MIEIQDIDPNSWKGIATLRGRCEALAASEGLAGVALFFRSQALFTDALGQFPSYRQRNEAWMAKREAKPVPIDHLRKALEAIRDGHNDPRTLAAQALSLHDTTEG